MPEDKLTGYVARIHQIKPDLELRITSLNDEGLANDVVIVNDEWVFRFAKGEFGLRSLARDKLVLDAVRPHVSLAIPAPLQAGEDYIVYRYIHGAAFTLQVLRQLDEHSTQQVADQLATFLRQLHSIGPSDTLPRTAAPTGRDFWQHRQREVQEKVYPLLLNHQREWAEDLFQRVLADERALAYEPRLIHGDLAPYHILFDTSIQQLSGVIDFGVAGLGDPATDIGTLLQAYGASFVTRLRRAYPEAEGYMPRAWFYAQAIELEWVLHGLNSGQPFWFTAHLGNARDI
jgi:aminoglycoside 2''-phosphotransferase